MIGQRLGVGPYGAMGLAGASSSASRSSSASAIVYSTNLGLPCSFTHW